MVTIIGMAAILIIDDSKKFVTTLLEMCKMKNNLLISQINGYFFVYLLSFFQIFKNNTSQLNNRNRIELCTK